MKISNIKNSFYLTDFSAGTLCIFSKSQPYGQEIVLSTFGHFGSRFMRGKREVLGVVIF